ncbi:GCN5-related N-acetyltransferase [Flavobacterium cauense R2A-7]|uniref:RimJ/RimL family protein N-acetyltransferase n=1 Tax=Flavobacterium cauense R2A-7 TaxID=1341154 RepID=V6RX84_9FLAO|nr:GNAT family N-acetyltransferase [Flavobacterium cauense]ESU18764.1 GCN5-related N-acetyltransferase [Flavobacterium cauense R2A-7]KGO81761.1 GNAT family acetyltransferase [Flavobacterium cauense R2A-7]TWI13794.1 RimJ/RimL family protein N-acetyltransferase [Flavobacterium cauense R2A-7]
MNIKIETERLILRPIIPSDAEGMFILDSNPNVHTYLGNNPIKSIDEAKGYIENIQNQYIQNGTGRFAVVLKDTNEFIGWAGIKLLTEPENNHVNVYEIGYRLQEPHWGKGYGSEAAKAWLEYGFTEMKIQKMYASVNKENAASKRILEKLGMQITSEFLWNDIPCYWLEMENNKL